MSTSMRRNRTRCAALWCNKCARGLAPDCGTSAAHELPDTPLSGASSLPHWIGLDKCFRTLARGVILSFTSTAKGRLKATLNAPIEPHRFLLEPFEARRFATFSGQFPQHPTSAETLLRRLYRKTKGSELSPETVHLYLQESAVEALANNPVAEASVALRTKKGMIRPRGLNQQRYVKEILGNDINFGIGPAGTGKTYLAVACAVDD